MYIPPTLRPILSRNEFSKCKVVAPTLVDAYALLHELVDQLTDLSASSGPAFSGNSSFTPPPLKQQRKSAPLITPT
ncbi:hypothetical protein SK128_014685 [Halocaridina rubra]|uniref:Uncharacterized protein n=1 Tax=Halocaridina rubra TaxID=373956 RepID=A0AAN9A592_HALRR